MTEQPTQEPNQEPKKKSKGLPTWVWFVGTFAIVSLLGNIVFGGNTWITTSSNFVTNTYASLFPERDTSKDDFCLSGAVSEIDKTNVLAVITEAGSLVETTTGTIGYASVTEDLDVLATVIKTVQESSPQYQSVGERLQTAKNCGDPTFEYLMQDLGTSLINMGKNFDQWNPETLIEDPALLIMLSTLVQAAGTQADALLIYVENLK